MLTLLNKHCPKKIIKTFLIEDIFYKFANEKILMGYSGGFGEIDS